MFSRKCIYAYAGKAVVDVEGDASIVTYPKFGVHEIDVMRQEHPETAGFRVIALDLNYRTPKR